MNLIHISSGDDNRQTHTSTKFFRFLVRTGVRSIFSDLTDWKYGTLSLDFQFLISFSFFFSFLQTSTPRVCTYYLCGAATMRVYACHV